MNRNPVAGGGGMFHANWPNTDDHSANLESLDLTFTDNVIIGVGFDLMPGGGKTHRVERNYIIGGKYCRLQCTPESTSIIGGGGRVELRDNVWQGGFSAVVWKKKNNFVYENNIQMSASHGFTYHASPFDSLRVQAYKNGIGVVNKVNNPRNFIAAQNGIGYISNGDFLGAQPKRGTQRGTTESKSTQLAIKDLAWVLGGEGGWEANQITIIGRMNYTYSGMCFDERTKFTNGHGGTTGAESGGLTSGYINYVDYHYSGYQWTGRLNNVGLGMRRNNVASGWFEVDGVKFEGFSGTDSCGFKNVGIGNEAAAYGEGGERAKRALPKVRCNAQLTQTQHNTTPPRFATLRTQQSLRKPSVLPRRDAEPCLERLHPRCRQVPLQPRLGRREGGPRHCVRQVLDLRHRQQPG